MSPELFISKLGELIGRGEKWREERRKIWEKIQKGEKKNNVEKHQNERRQFWKERKFELNLI